MSEFDKCEMLHHGWEILWELGNKAGHIKVGIYSIRQCEVVSLGQDLDAVRECSLTTHALLEGGTCSTPAIDFSIKQRFNNEFG